MLPNNISEAGLTLLFLLFILITTEDCKTLFRGDIIIIIITITITKFLNLIGYQLP